MAILSCSSPTTQFGAIGTSMEMLRKNATMPPICIFMSVPSAATNHTLPLPGNVAQDLQPLINSPITFPLA
jgi:hypothetical protein